MRFCSDCRRTCITASILALILLLGLASDSQAIERLRVTVGDTTGTPGQENSVVTVFLTNTQDQIAAFTVHLMLTRDDIAAFKNSLDTVVDTTYWNEWCCRQWSGTLCVDSAKDTCAVDFPETEHWDFRRIDTVEVFTGSMDTAGTLISGWEKVESRAISTGDAGLDIKVTAIANLASVPGVKSPIFPQQGGVLFRLLADILPVPPDQTDRTVIIQIDVADKKVFSFSTPLGEAIGWTTVYVPHNYYYMCENWEPPPGTACYSWKQVHDWECPPEGCDSVYEGTVGVPVLDTTLVKLFDGELEVLNYMCGDCNGDGSLSIGDISLLIDVLFLSQLPLIQPPERCNVNCSTEQPVELTIGDVSTLIDRLFITMSPMCCE